jgi:hypothetical protein
MGWFDQCGECFYDEQVGRFGLSRCKRPIAGCTRGICSADVAPSFNGRTADSGSAYRGSNPWGAANLESIISLTTDAPGSTLNLPSLCGNLRSFCVNPHCFCVKNCGASVAKLLILLEQLQLYRFCVLFEKNRPGWKQLNHGVGDGWRPTRTSKACTGHPAE